MGSVLSSGAIELFFCYEIAKLSHPLAHTKKGKGACGCSAAAATQSRSEKRNELSSGGEVRFSLRASVALSPISTEKESRSLVPIAHLIGPDRDNDR